ncbi:MAG: hypothetical protein HY719_13780 [Planctomycetes bacterium]|nr:hypothetical protein [Planctomycetota bacterium]
MNTNRHESGPDDLDRCACGAHQPGRYVALTADGQTIIEVCETCWTRHVLPILTARRREMLAIDALHAEIDRCIAAERTDTP